jgi:hypothetical protein
MQAYSPQVATGFKGPDIPSTGLKTFFVIWSLVMAAILIALFGAMQRHLVSDQPPQTSSLASYMETAAPDSYAWLLTHPGRGGTMQCPYAGANPMAAVKANSANAFGDPRCI